MISFAVVSEASLLIVSVCFIKGNVFVRDATLILCTESKGLLGMTVVSVYGIISVITNGLRSEQEGANHDKSDPVGC